MKRAEETALQIIILFTFITKTNATLTCDAESGVCKTQHKVSLVEERQIYMTDVLGQCYHV